MTEKMLRRWARGNTNSVGEPDGHSLQHVFRGHVHTTDKCTSGARYNDVVEKLHIDSSVFLGTYNTQIW